MGKGRDGKFVLRVACGVNDVEVVAEAIARAAMASGAVLLESTQTEDEAEVLLGGFKSKSEARRIGSQIVGRLHKRAEIDLRLRERQ